MNEENIVEIITGNPVRASILKVVAKLELPDCWIGGGFVRNSVWDALFQKPPTPINDIDVVYFKPLTEYGAHTNNLVEKIKANEENLVWQEESEMTQELTKQFHGVLFEIKNQARMHLSNARLRPTAEYESTSDALRDWVETATATGIHYVPESNSYELLTPFGVYDLAHGIVRPTDKDYTERSRERAEAKKWFSLWPGIRFEEAK